MVTEAKAIEIASKHVISRQGPDALNERDASSEREDSGWHVWFPWIDQNMLGGESHVRLDDNGSIIEFYSTQ